MLCVRALTVNNAPVVLTPIPSQNALPSQLYNYTVKNGTFLDVDAGDVLTCTAVVRACSVAPYLSYRS